jgi:hypothetical protein
MTTAHNNLTYSRTTMSTATNDIDFPVPISQWMVLDEPDLHAGQVWIVLAMSVQNGNALTLHEGPVIADTLEQALEAVREFKAEPIGAFSEFMLEQRVVQFSEGRLTPEELSAYREAYNNLGITNDAQMLARMREWLDILANVRQKRGAGAMTDGRPHDHYALRRDLIDLERQGQRVYWHFHPNLTQEEMEAISWPEFVAKVRALGQGYRDEARRRFAKHMAASERTP